jgi:hypothetical protein
VALPIKTASKLVTMTLKIPAVCLTILLSTLCVWSFPTFTTPFDSYGNICIEDEHARLDNFAIQLQQSTSTVGYIIVYAGRSSCVDEAKYRGKRAKDWVVKRGVKADRLIVKDGGYRKDVQTILLITGKEVPLEPMAANLEKDEISIRRCVDKVFARVLCPNRN